MIFRKCLWWLYSYFTDKETWVLRTGYLCGATDSYPKEKKKSIQSQLDRFHFISMPIVKCQMHMFLEEINFWRKSITKGKINWKCQPLTSDKRQFICFIWYHSCFVILYFSSFSTRISSCLVPGILGKNSILFQSADFYS